MGGMKSVVAGKSAPPNRAVEAWEERFQELLTCRQPDGSLRVSPSGPKSIFGLPGWCTRQRRAYLLGKLSPERVARLEAVGFCWDYDYAQQAWMDKYRELEQFHQKHGHARVLSTSPGCSRLFDWNDRQRQNRKKGLLTEDRVRLLEALGFEWDSAPTGLGHRAEVLEAAWRARLAELAAFKERHGHCQVPYSVAEYRGLAVWANAQRVSRRKGQLTEGRLAALEALGFVWDYPKVHGQRRQAKPVTDEAVPELPPVRVPARRGRPPLKRG